MHTRTTVDTLVTADELAAQRAVGGPVLVDVRTPTEFAASSVDGAVLLPLDDLLAAPAAAAAAAADRDVVLVCRSGARSEQARAALAAHGAAPRVLEGGMLAWGAAGQPVRTGHGWELQRQVNLVAGTLVLTGLLAGRWARPARHLTTFVGGGLVTAALTDTCTMARVLERLPWNQAPEIDVAAALRAVEDAG